jgi:predicted metal-dependent hydrolase
MKRLREVREIEADMFRIQRRVEGLKARPRYLRDHKAISAARDEYRKLIQELDGAKSQLRLDV